MININTIDAVLLSLFVAWLGWFGYALANYYQDDEAKGFASAFIVIGLGIPLILGAVQILTHFRLEYIP